MALPAQQLLPPALPAPLPSLVRMAQIEDPKSIPGSQRGCEPLPPIEYALPPIEYDQPRPGYFYRTPRAPRALGFPEQQQRGSRRALGRGRRWAESRLGKIQREGVRVSLVKHFDPEVRPVQ